MRFLAKSRSYVNNILISTGFQIERSRDYLPFKTPIDKKYLKTNFQQKKTNDFLLRFASYCDLLIDVGANRGSFADHFSWINPNADMILIEPIPELYDALLFKYRAFPKVICLQSAISDKVGESIFHVTANDGQSSSLLEIGQRHLEAAPHAHETRKITVKTNTLDEILGEFQFSNAFLKIDVQGNDLPALKGAEKLLKKVSAIHIEVSIQSLYEGDVLGYKVWEFLNLCGFVLYGIDPWFRDPRSNGELLQADLFFVQKSHL
jgi:FkbM family methyltransferase